MQDLCKKFPHLSQRVGLDLVSNKELQAEQALVCFAEIFGSRDSVEEERMLSLVFLME